MASNYQPTYAHVNWLDDVDRVQAGGGHGFNQEFAAIEAEFTTLARVLSGALTLPGLTWGNNSTLSSDQGGSIELGGNLGTAGVGTPYIDFHYAGVDSDFNARIINDGNGVLSIKAADVYLEKSLWTVGSGVRANGVCVGFDPAGLGYAYPYETVGIAEPAFNLRLQSHNWILFHTGPDAASLANPRAWIDTGGTFATVGGVIVGSDSDNVLVSRHVHGKGSGNNASDTLYLNWGVGYGVQISGGGARGDLHVAGNIYADGGTIAATGISTDSSGRIGLYGYSPTPRTSGWGGGIHTFDLEAEGTIWSRGGVETGNRDVAENFTCDGVVEPGDVVVLDRERDAVVRSSRANDPMVVGVVSVAPGVLLGSDPATSEPEPVAAIGLAGRVQCKATTENGPISPGDLLTTGSTPGTAMRAHPIDSEAGLIVRAGIIIGKALEPLNDHAGIIDVLVFAG
jgi:hypothetical protein